MPSGFCAQSACLCRTFPDPVAVSSSRAPLHTLLHALLRCTPAAAHKEPEVRWISSDVSPARTVDYLAYSLEPCRLQYLAAGIRVQARRMQLLVVDHLPTHCEPSCILRLTDS